MRERWLSRARHQEQPLKDTRTLSIRQAEEYRNRQQSILRGYYFKKELEELINKHTIENVCDTPDFLLSEMICSFITLLGHPFKGE